MNTRERAGPVRPRRPGAYWASDTFAQYVSPWLALVDTARYQRTVDRIEALAPTVIAGCHTPVIDRGYVGDAIAATRTAPWAKVAPQPDQAVLDTIRRALEAA